MLSEQDNIAENASGNPEPEPEITFTKLHEGTDCKCCEFDDIEESGNADIFARLTKNNPLTAFDFQSNHEKGQPPRDEACRVICGHRGVSMNKIDATNEALILRDWKAKVSYRPRTAHLYCKFRLKLGAGKVWFRPSSDTEPGKSHHNLLKSDGFVLALVEVLQTIDLKSRV